MISTTVYMTQEQAAKLRALTSLSRIPTAEYIREAIDDVLKKYEKVILAGEAKPK